MFDNMKASDIAQNIKWHNFNISVDEVNSKTDWKKQSCAVIYDDNEKLFGIISESDILEAEKQNKNLKALKCWELCSHNMFIVKPDTKLEEIISLILDKNVHHILVESEEGAPNKIISTIDILRRLKEAS